MNPFPSATHCAERQPGGLLTPPIEELRGGREALTPQELARINEAAQAAIDAYALSLRVRVV
jgi:hypothetical protein